jgi:hypothetical protein
MEMITDAFERKAAQALSEVAHWKQVATQQRQHVRPKSLVNVLTLIIPTTYI